MGIKRKFNENIQYLLTPINNNYENWVWAINSSIKQLELDRKDRRQQFGFSEETKNLLNLRKITIEQSNKH